MFEHLPIAGLILCKPTRHADARGYFSESWRRDLWSEAGVDVDFVQDNHSLSLDVGTVRGLHFQTPPHAQAKLVRCTRGAILDVAVDIRAGSPTYGRHVAIELTPDNGLQLFIPAGFAHGFCTLKPMSEVQYRCSAYYAQANDAGLAFDDPDLAIAWPVTRSSALLSDKDARQPAFVAFASPFAYGGEPA